MSYEIEAVKKELEVNVVVKIGDDYFATKQVDSGLVVPEEHICVDQPQVSGTTVDIRDIRTPVGSFSFQLQESNDNPVITTLIMQDSSQLLGKEVVAYVGFITGSFDFADYLEVARTSIVGVTKLRNGYSITSREATSLIDVEAFNLHDITTVSLLVGSTSVTLSDASAWQNSGYIKIDNEIIGYSGRSGNTLTGLARGQYGTTAAEHGLGATVFYITIKEEINPIDFILQCILSKNGDGVNHPTYDVIPNGPGLNPDLVDIASFESIRDNFFLGEEHNYYVYDNETILNFLEKSALLSTTTRLVTVGGKIRLTILDQINLEEEIPLLDESSIVGTPTWGLTIDKIVNVIEAYYDFNIASEKYETKVTFKDLDSIALYGEKKALVLELQGVVGPLGGSAIATERAGRLLSRLSTARGKVDVTAHLGATTIPVGGAVQLIHRYLPQQGGTLGFSDSLEIISTDLDLRSARVKLKLEFTSYTGIRVPFIAPSPKITAITDQKTITVNDASLLRVGYSIRLFEDGPLDIDLNPTAGSYLPDNVNVIESIVGNVVTFRDEFTTPLSIGLWVKFADYDECNEFQKARYAFIGENTGFFSDGSKSYQIIF